MSNVRVKTALLSVYDKTGIVEFAKGLTQLGVKIISTGGTARKLSEAGIEVSSVKDVTGSPEILGGRVKSLHPKIHGALLADRDNSDHMSDLEKLDISTIDLVCVNLYPFIKVTADPDYKFEDAVENIDIGGPTMIRSSAKNHKDVVVVTSPDRYSMILQQLKANDMKVDQQTRRKLALEAFKTTAEYDTYIQDYLSQQISSPDDKSLFPDKLTMTFAKWSDLRYGENPHQQAALFTDAKDIQGGWGMIEKLGGKELSFNNLVDANAALELVMEFSQPSACVIKHTNPCGAASDDDIVEAYRRAYLGDPIAAMGGIIAINRPVDEKLADAIMNSLKYYGKAAGSAAFFAEIIIAPEFDPKALELIRTAKTWGQNVRLLKVNGWDGTGVDPLAENTPGGWDMKRLRGALLAQTKDQLGINDDQWKVATELEPTEQQMKDLKFAWLVGKHTKSNAIVLAKNGTLTGTGAGQMSRVMSTKVAAELAGNRAADSVLASDAFFPFRDSIDQAAKVGVKAIIEPGGSKRDEEVIQAANEHKIPLILTGTRHFRH